jgi:Pyridoxamine 5'-phosphate oxidase
MARFHEKLTPELGDFITRQHVFFVASAAANGRINLSPKGMNTFRVLDEGRVAYLDLTGSGNETSGHILHDGRLTIMLCSFDEKPLILRLYGRGQVVHPRDPEWADLIARFTQFPGQRQIIVLHIDSLQTSCGFGVPQFTQAVERQTLIEWSEKKGTDGIRKYWAEKNQKTIDGLETKLLES